MCNTPDNFTAGKISLHVSEWRKITSDQWVLNAVRGLDIPFLEQPYQTAIPRPIRFKFGDQIKIDVEILKLLGRNVIEIVPISQARKGFISNIFIRPKKDGSVRLILNLKKLNEHIDNCHFKMETLKSAILLMRPLCFFASCDLCDAYFSLNVNSFFRQYLRFYWRGICYEFTCLPNGVNFGPRIFTKLLKCAFSHLRKHGYLNCGYIDDSLLVAYDFSSCKNNIAATVQLFDSLGLTIHPVKSVLIPTQIIEFLGFILNSITMTVSVSVEKGQKLVDLSAFVLSKSQCTIRDLAQLTGKFVACSPAVKYAALYTKRLEIFQTDMIRFHLGDYDSLITLSPACREDIQWWIFNIKHSSKPVLVPDFTYSIFTDSSQSGWGGTMGSHSTGGLWTSEERQLHINCLELKAVLLVLQSFCKNMRDVHLRIRSDNSVTVICINKQGSMKTPLNNITRDIWLFAIERGIWLSSEHIKGKDNTQADGESRANPDTEWKLKRTVFQAITDKFGVPTIDLFASRVNCQVPRYFSWRADPTSAGVDSFLQHWTGGFNYIFPPFSVIGQVLQKLQNETAEAILVLPAWSTACWFSQVLHMCITCPLLLPVTDDLLTLPGTDRVHPLLNKLHLTAFRVSGNSSKCMAFQKRLLTSSCAHGKIQRSPNMGVISHSGCIFAVNGALIPFHHL